MAGFGLESQVDVMAPTIQRLRSMDCRGAHVYSWGSLECYFWLEEISQKNGVRFITDDIVELSHLPGKNSVKTFHYSLEILNLAALREQVKKGVVYSFVKLPLAGEKLFQEARHHLPTVFDPAQYSSPEKRKLRLRYPLNWCASHGVTCEPITTENFKEADDLHERWVKHKLDDPKTFKMMFPGKRYIRCVELALKHPDDYIAWLFRINGVATSVQVYSRQQEHAFGLAGFGEYEHAPSNFMNHTTLLYMSKLRELGIVWVNDGYVLNKGLAAFKAHYPYELLTIYAYSKEKPNE